MNRVLKFASIVLAIVVCPAVTLATVSVSLSPTSVHVQPGGQTQFTAVVNGTSNDVVIWSLAGTTCSGLGCGQITNGGLYLAPSNAPASTVVTVTATSLADLTASASAAVILGSTSDITVSVSPAKTSVVLGQQQFFTAFVSGTTITGVTWELTGASCSQSACGTLTTDGTYTAPSTLPTPPQVTITAVSVADPSKSGSAVITITPPVAVSISPVSVELNTGAKQQFTATVTGTTNTAVSWSVTGNGCSGAACGTISASGLYAAPSAVPTPPQVSVTATSVADTTKSSTATVTIALPISITVAPATAQVLTGAQQQFTATVTGTTNTAVTWSVTGSGCSGAACGTISTSGLYTAPSTVPTPNGVKVTATSVADKTKAASATVSIIQAISVSVAPAAVQVVVGDSQQFTATVSGTSNTNVSWAVSGSGCSGTSCGTISPSGLYFAPAAVPNPAKVLVTATSAADDTKSNSATVTVIPPIIVKLSPTTATVTVDGKQQFTASVSGTTNTGIIWTVSGSGCSGASCGVVSSAGLYTAPATVPVPAQVTIKAASAADSISYRTATVTIIPPVVVKISPTSAKLVTGHDQQFSATVTGTTNVNVTWSVTGAGCTGLACGSITSTGFYSAPGRVPSPAEVTVTATSVVDTSKSSSAIVTILPPVSVSVSPATVQVVISGHQQFTASVTGTTNTGVTWSLAGTGCTGSACGTISSVGLYAAPGTIPNPAQVKVTATSNADGTKSGSAIVTIIPTVAVTISPTSVVVPVDSQQQFHATVDGSNNNSVDWSISGPGCSGSACGSITSSGLYTAPLAIPSPATIVVKATAQIDTSQSASATVNIVATQNSKLKGHYAFLFTGFNSDGVYQAAGSFTADGNGNVTDGTEDVNSTSGPATNVPFIGTYQVNEDNRGTLTFSSSTGGQTFRFALNSTSTNGRFIEFDDSGVSGSGVIEQQDTTAFTLAALKGPYVLRLVGQDSAPDRIGALSIFDFNGTGDIVGGSMDVNDGGTLLPTFGSIGGTYSIAGTGRGTARLSIPGFEGGTFDFAFYAVSASKLLFVSMDPLSTGNPIFSGPAELQSGAPYVTSSFSGPTTFSLGGETGNIAQVTVGRIVFDGISQPLVEFDQNTGGTVTTGNVLTGAYDIEINGSGGLNLDGSNGQTKVWLMYAIAPNHAYLMDASSSDVGMGELNPQSDKPPFANTDILGTYLLGSGDPLDYEETLYSGVGSFDGQSALAGTEDISSSSALSPDQSLKGSYSVSSSLNDGRGTLLLTSPSGATFALWVTSASEVLGVEIDSSNPQPVILHFEQ
jgi:Fe-S cluster assembly iron-binding protein IscA